MAGLKLPLLEIAARGYARSRFMPFHSTPIVNAISGERQ
jgi:hypothetical protein